MKLSKFEWILLIVAVLLMVTLGFLLGQIYHRSLSSDSWTSITEIPTAEVPAARSTTAPPTTEEPTTSETEDLNSPKFHTESLEAALEAALADCTGRWAVYAEELNSGASVFCGKDAGVRDPMIAASMIKMFIMAKTYELIELGAIETEDVYQDMFDMITISDNDDTNRLTTYLGSGDATAGRALVTDYALRMGLPEVKHNRLMLDFNGSENYVSVGACAKLLRMIYEGKCVSEEASRAMLEILLAQTDRNYIPAGIPQGIDIALKGGDLQDCQGDCAIVFLEGNPYIVCIISNGSHNDFNTQKIGQLSGLIYEAMAEHIS